MLVIKNGNPTAANMVKIPTRKVTQVKKLLKQKNI